MESNNVLYSPNNSQVNVIPSTAIFFKVIYNNQNKRINDTPKSLAEMKEKIKRLYELNDKKFEGMRIYTHVSEGDFNLIDEKIYIEEESDYSRVISDLRTFTKSICKINLEFTDEKCNLNSSYNDTYIFDSPKKLASISNESSKKSSSLTDIDLHSERNQQVRFAIQCDICLINPIKDIQYICIICDDLYLCRNCEPYHNHPMIKFKSNEFCHKEDICNLIMDNKSDKKNTFKEIILGKESLFSKLKYKLQTFTKYHVRIEMEVNYFLIKPNTKFRVPFSMINDGVVSLSQDTYVYAKNCKDIYINSEKVGRLFVPGEKIEMYLDCHTGNRFKEYQIELNPYQKDTKIEYTPFKFKIKVTENLHADLEENIKKSENLATSQDYHPEDIVSTLPNEKKVVLSEIIRNNLSTKDIFDICEILDRHQWILTKDVLDEIK